MTDGKRVVLCIDDNEVDRVILQRHLARYPEQQYTFCEAATAQEGYEKIAADKPDCVLVDYLLPDQNGLEFIKTLLTDYPDCPPLIMLTGQGNEAVAAEAISMGVLDYVIKSKITPTGLYRAIEHAIEKRSLVNKIKDQNKSLILTNQKLEIMNQDILRSYQVLSHELKTPLTSLQEFLSILSDQLVGPINSEQSKLILFALESCSLMKLYINDLLDTSLLDLGKVTLHPQPGSLYKILELATNATQPAMKEKEIVLALHIAPDLPQVYVDDKRVFQVIVNIINNAIKFTPQQGHIDVKVNLDHDSTGFIRLDISDSGIGISEANLKKIFERFYQVKQLATDPHGGLGLGLSICKQIVSLHGGNIFVASTPGKGSTFSFTLPIAVVSQDTPSIAS